MKKLVVDKALCIGCGTCVALCSKVFRLDGEGKSEVIDQNAGTEEEIKSAIDACPVQAVSWQEEED